jgi:hypothetical protein
MIQLKFSAQTQPSKPDQIAVIMLPSKRRTQPRSVLSCILLTGNFPTPYLASSQPSPDGRAGTAPIPAAKYEVSPYSIPLKGQWQQNNATLTQLSRCIYHHLPVSLTEGSITSSAPPTPSSHCPANQPHITSLPPHPPEQWLGKPPPPLPIQTDCIFGTFQSISLLPKLQIPPQAPPLCGCPLRLLYS